MLIAVTDRPEPGVILTHRPEDMRAHPGQVAFPGGKLDPGEDAVAAALREAHEELAINPGDVRIIGASDRFITGTGYDVTPVLALVPPDLPIVPNPAEVAAWFEAPLGFLLDPANHAHKEREWFGKMRPYIEIDWQGHLDLGNQPRRSSANLCPGRLAWQERHDARSPARATWTRRDGPRRRSSPRSAPTGAPLGRRRGARHAARQSGQGHRRGHADRAATTCIALLGEAGIRTVPTGIDHGTVTAILPGGPVEVTTLRRDVSTDGRRATVAFADRLARGRRAARFHDQRALRASGRRWRSRTGSAGSPTSTRTGVRFIGDARQRIREDHLRILRYYRFEARFGSELDPEAEEACAELARHTQGPQPRARGDGAAQPARPARSFADRGADGGRAACCR